MIAIPALDLREGACVQLVGGSYDAERVRRPDPLVVAREWREAGFQRLHVVDLDAAMGLGHNSGIIRELVAAGTASVQVGGGLRTTEAVRAVLEAGARQAIVGTRALEDPAWLAEVATAFPGTIIVATDVRGRQLVSRGWQESLPRTILDFIAEIHELPLAALLVTAVHQEGTMQGPDLDLMTDVVRAARLPVMAAGGIGSVADLRSLAATGVSAAILGMALYTGALDPSTVAGEFAA